MSDNVTPEQLAKEKRFRIQAGIFLTSIGCVAAAVGFSKTVTNARREEQKLIEKGIIQNVQLLDAGSSLALRALGWGTLYAVLGTGTICYGIWKLSGATNMTEFRQKVGSALPRIKKNERPSSRTEFEGLTDLLQYLSTWKSEK